MPKGGLRPGAGRKNNSGAFGQKTVVRRIPVSLAQELDQFVHSLKNKTGTTQTNFEAGLRQWGTLHSGLSLPLYEGRVSAGFPSPADDHLETSLDLNQHLIRRPSATFFVRASGESMINAGINDQDILVVDRSLEPGHEDIVIAALNGELTVKRLSLKDRQVKLQPENPRYPVIDITEDMEFLIWGVVTSVIHQFKGSHIRNGSCPR